MYILFNIFHTNKFSKKLINAMLLMLSRLATGAAATCATGLAGHFYLLRACRQNKLREAAPARDKFRALLYAIASTPTATPDMSEREKYLRHKMQCANGLRIINNPYSMGDKSDPDISQIGIYLDGVVRDDMLNTIKDVVVHDADIYRDMPGLIMPYGSQFDTHNARGDYAVVGCIADWYKPILHFPYRRPRLPSNASSDASSDTMPSAATPTTFLQKVFYGQALTGKLMRFAVPRRATCVRAHNLVQTCMRVAGRDEARQHKCVDALVAMITGEVVSEEEAAAYHNRRCSCAFRDCPNPWHEGDDY